MIRDDIRKYGHLWIEIFVSYAFKNINYLKLHATVYLTESTHPSISCKSKGVILGRKLQKGVTQHITISYDIYISIQIIVPDA